ncbi:uncharacterized protein PRCAT00005485001 [Priceomyces carsonii]|uniref:uncharacterized protein n=1 Tax=Priceomyces carsonii TaxID=28549 RepID=UPI002ED92FC5|nr:unnamed protein product [Priceomyces carsonii]
MTSLLKDSINVMGDPNKEDLDGVLVTEDSGEPATKESSISLKASIQDWWNGLYSLFGSSILNIEASRRKNRRIEYDLFRAMLSDDIFIKNPDIENETDTSDLKEGKLYSELKDVEVEPGVFIHEFYLENNLECVPESDEIHIVMIHGYMAALGYYIKNVESLLKSRPGVRIHAIDLIGFGNSSRPKFPPEFLKTTKNKEEEIDQIIAIENWFIDKIENWRKKRNIRTFKLIGHSMGAYLSCCYLMKYNNQYKKVDESQSPIVEEVILVSPMGTESNPHSLLNEKNYEFTTHESGGDPFKELITKQGDSIEHDELIKLWEKLGQPRFPKNFILKTLWEHSISPFQVLQKFGPLYSKILSYWSFQRFRNLKSETGEQSIDLILKLHDYSFSIFNQFQGSGELAITKLINHEILARLPLSDRGFVHFVISSNLKVLWLYGDKDWMNDKGGRHIHEEIAKKNKNLSEFEVIENAGHHIYLDNPPAFNEACLKFFGLDKS